MSPTRRGGSQESATTEKPRLLHPPARVWVTLASLAAAIVLVRTGWLETLFGTLIDGAVRNIITLILSFSGLVAVVSWFLRESGHPRRTKWAVAGVLAGLVTAAVATLRIERVSGDLVPEFAWRWQPSPDFLLERKGAATAPAAAAPAWQATATDVPRFFGSSGTGVVEVAIDPEWESRPPREAWRRPIGAGWGSFATCGGHAVTLEQRGPEEVVACYAIADGTEEWVVAVEARHQTVLGGVGPRSTPAIHDGVVYSAGATGWLHAIDGASGRVVWKTNVLDDLGIDAEAHAVAVAWGRAGSPLVVDDLVVVPGGGPRADGPVSLVAYDRADGTRRWTAGDLQIAYASPVVATVAGRRLIVSGDEGAVTAYDPADGSTVWRCPWPGHSNSDANCSQPVFLDDRRFLLSKGYGLGAAAFRIASTDAVPWTIEELWRSGALLKTKFTTSVLHGDHVYGLSDGILECVSVADGRRAWKGGRYGQGQVLRAGDHVIVQTEPGEIVVLDADPKAARVRGRLPALDGQTWNNPCLAGDRLLVRNASEAACYVVPLRDAAVERVAASRTGR